MWELVRRRHMKVVPEVQHRRQQHHRPERGEAPMAGEATEHPAGDGGRGCYWCFWCGWWCQQRRLVWLRQLEVRWRRRQLLLLLPARY